MIVFRARIIINAPAPIVWKTLTDLSLHPHFDPHCLNIAGQLKHDEIITVHTKIEKRRVYKVKIESIIPNAEMIWSYHYFFILFRSSRRFTVIAKDDQTSEFQVEEVFKGPLLRFFLHRIPELNPVLIDLSRGLKRFIESRL